MITPRKKQKMEFHPLEIAFCGYSNSGKTTLLEKVIHRLSSNYDIGYIKHDAHSFSMDKEGKDTFKIKKSGATGVYISSSDQQALIQDQLNHYFLQKQIYLDRDIVLVEGYKKSQMPKFIFLDDSLEILKEFSDEKFSNILGFIGKQQDRPSVIPESFSKVPYYERNDVKSIIVTLTHYIFEKLNQRPVFGLLLAGGQSSRMQQDKALLKYSEQPQIKQTFELMQKYVDQCFISARFNQRDDSSYFGQQVIYDRLLDMGPMGGILSAMMAYPDAAWMVVACDLPFLDEITLHFLIENRKPLKMATAYISSSDGMPEPLCTLYEPKSRQRLFEALAIGHECPRKVLLNSNIHLLHQPNSDALNNINYPEEYQQVKKQFQLERNL